MFAGNDGMVGSLLVDGFVTAAWKMTRLRGAAVLHIHPLRALTADEQAAITTEGEGLLAFVAADSNQRDIQFAPL